jgi:hypothetical protein
MGACCLVVFLLWYFINNFICEKYDAMDIHAPHLTETHTDNAGVWVSVSATRESRPGSTGL